MVKQKRLLVALCGLLFGVLFLAGCCCCYVNGVCPPNCNCCKECPPSTPQAAPVDWANQIDVGENAAVIEETTEIILAGEEQPLYAQALLYRGVAEFNLDNLESASDDLASAQVLSDRLSNDEQLQLFRTQMVVLAKLGDQNGAEQAFQNALAIAPADQQDEIRSEYENTFNP